MDSNQQTSGLPSSPKRQKWVHPLKGRTLLETMADCLKADETGFWSNKGALHLYQGCALWGFTPRTMTPPIRKYHSWDSLKNCLKYGFDIDEEDCIIAKHLGE